MFRLSDEYFPPNCKLSHGRKVVEVNFSAEITNNSGPRNSFALVSENNVYYMAGH